MTSRTVIDGNAFYEIDEECVKLKKRRSDGMEGGMHREGEKAGEIPGAGRVSGSGVRDGKRRGL